MKNRIVIGVFVLIASAALIVILRPAGTRPVIHVPYESHGSVNKEDLINLGKQSAPIIRQAVLLIKDKNFSQAIQLLNSVIDHFPIDPYPYILLSTLYTNLGNENEALKILERGTDVDTDHDFIFREYFKNIPPAQSGAESSSSETVWIAAFQDNKKAAISYIFDDGPKSVYTHGFPVFDKYGYKATVTMVPGNIEGNELAGTWEQWRDAQKRGFEIGNHTLHHRFLRELSNEVLEEEINGSFDAIVEETGEPPFTFVFPFERFHFDPEAVRIVRERHWVIADHNFLEDVYPKIFHPLFGGRNFSAQTAIEITKFAIQKNLWLVAQCHAMGLPHKKTFKPVTAEFLDEHLAFVKQNDYRIWIDTFRNIYSYLFEKMNTAISLEEDSTQRVRFRLNCPLDSRVFAVPLTLGINSKGRAAGPVVARQDEADLDVKIDGEIIFVNVRPVNSVVTIEF